MVRNKSVGRLPPRSLLANAKITIDERLYKDRAIEESYRRIYCHLVQETLSFLIDPWNLEYVLPRHYR